MIVWVRHGETESNRAGALQGRGDLPLTALGRAQVERLAGYVAADAPLRVVASPLERTRCTAAAIASTAGVPLELDERLLELDYGEWEGRPVASVTAEEWSRWRADPTWAPPGGESLRDVGIRVGAFCAATDPEAGTVVAVSHVSPIKAAVAWALDAGDELAWRTHVSVASVTRVERRAGAGVLLSFNETAHLHGLDEDRGPPRR